MNNYDKFKADFIDAIYSLYSKVNITYDASVRDFRKVFIDYVTFLNRLIAPKPRNVHISREIIETISGHNPESQRLNNLIQIMKRKFEKGEDVNGYLSKSIKRVEKSDALFDDWHIKHLHMTTNGKMDFFDDSRQMSKDLLFVVVLDKDVYFLQITNHEENDFENLDLLRIIKNNWKDKLLFEHSEIVDVDKDLKTPESIKSCRSAGVNYFVHNIDGKYYSLKYGRGYSLDRKSLDITLLYIEFDRTINSLIFEYSHLELYEFTIGVICKIVDFEGNVMELPYRVFDE